MNKKGLKVITYPEVRALYNFFYPMPLLSVVSNIIVSDLKLSGKPGLLPFSSLQQEENNLNVFKGAAGKKYQIVPQ